MFCVLALSGSLGRTLPWRMLASCDEWAARPFASFASSPARWSQREMYPEYVLNMLKYCKRISPTQVSSVHRSRVRSSSSDKKRQFMARIRGRSNRCDALDEMQKAGLVGPALEKKKRTKNTLYFHAFFKFALAPTFRPESKHNKQHRRRIQALSPGPKHKSNMVARGLPGPLARGDSPGSPAMLNLK